MESTEIVRRAVEAMRYRQVHQHREVWDISWKTVTWAARHSLVVSREDVTRTRAIRVGELAAYAFSRESPDVVQLGADLVTWLFLFDDTVGEAPPHLTDAEHRGILLGYEGVIREGIVPRQRTGFHVALHDWVKRAVALGATQDWVDRFADDMKSYFGGCAEETRYRRERWTPSVDEYRWLRQRTVGTSPAFAVIELGLSGVVPRTEMLRRDVRRARGVAALLTAWVNDVYSFPKESAGTDPLNLVAALATEQRLSVSMAVAKAVDTYNQDLRELERVVASVKETNPSRPLALYLDGLIDWVHGNRIWIRRCGRYL